MHARQPTCCCCTGLHGFVRTSALAFALAFAFAFAFVAVRARRGRAPSCARYVRTACTAQQQIAAPVCPHENEPSGCCTFLNAAPAHNARAHRRADENLFWCGTTQNLIEMYDKRQQTYAVRINNAGWNSMCVPRARGPDPSARTSADQLRCTRALVSLYCAMDGWEGSAARCRLRSQVSGNGQTLLSGDQHGLIKVWDVRELKSREPR